LTAATYSSDFNSGTPAGMTLFGAANVSGGYLKLTSVSDPFGIVYIDDFGGGQLVQSFHATFKAALFGSTCCGGGALPADGFSFNLVPAAAASALPSPGYGQPAEELNEGLAVNFDSWDNGGGEAPAIDVKWKGTIIASTCCCALVYQPCDTPWSNPLETAERDFSVPSS
jgi:hypothetical protein